MTDSDATREALLALPRARGGSDGMSAAAFLAVLGCSLGLLLSDAPESREANGPPAALVTPVQPTATPWAGETGDEAGSWAEGVPASIVGRKTQGAGTSPETPPPRIYAERDLYPRSAYVLLSIVQAFPADELDTAFDVAWCESRYRARAQNASSTAAGVMQFIGATWEHTRERYVPEAPPFEAGRYSPYWSALLAAALVEHEGWRHWNESRRCWG